MIEAVKARGSNAGRVAIDPRILFALWLYATLEGVGSGREVARLCLEHDAYRWICGGVSVNHLALNDFRAGNEALMDEPLTDNVAALAAVGAIRLEWVAQDGMRVRAAAGAGSFRRQASLQEHLREASELVPTLKTQVQGRPWRRESTGTGGAGTRRAHRRGVGGGQVAQRPQGPKAQEARASTTDAEASNMKMGDGGFRPAYNVQFASDCATQVIVGAARRPRRSTKSARRGPNA